MKFLALFALALVATVQANPIDPSVNVESLLSRAQAISKKASEFIYSQKVLNNGKYLVTLERDELAVKVMITDLVKHQTGQVQLTTEQLALIETSIEQYEGRIEQDIEEIRKQLAGHTQEPMTTVTGITEETEGTTEPSTTETTVETETATSEHHEEFTTHPSYQTLPPTPVPNDNLVITAEEMVTYTRQLLTWYQGPLRAQLDAQLNALQEILVIALDPSNSGDKFFTAIVLGNELKGLRDLISQIKL